MPRNSNIDLQNHLFETLENLKDGEIDTDHAKSICEVAKHIIEAKKLEHDNNELKLRAFELIGKHNGHVDEKKLLGEENEQ